MFYKHHSSFLITWFTDLFIFSKNLGRRRKINLFFLLLLGGGEINRPGQLAPRG